MADTVKRIQADKIRTIVRQLRKEGYTYKIFYNRINYNATD